MAIEPFAVGPSFVVEPSSFVAGPFEVASGTGATGTQAITLAACKRSTAAVGNMLAAEQSLVKAQQRHLRT